MDSFNTIKEDLQTEIVEKKSKFICNLIKIETQEQAENVIKQIKKKYYDARHNCSAFVIGSKAQLTRSSDDGEPSGTAGRPMLEVLLGSEIRNIAVVVTRYFGGTLLGTGGLVRAYSGAVKLALEQCETARQRFGIKLQIKTDYNYVGKIQYLLADRKIEMIDSVYAQDVEMTVIVPIEEYDRLCKDLTEATSAKAELVELERLYYESISPVQKSG